MAGARAQIFDILFTESQHDRLVSDEVSDDVLFVGTQQASCISFVSIIHGPLAMDDYSYDLPAFSRGAVQSLLGDMNQMPDGTDYFFPFMNWYLHLLALDLWMFRLILTALFAMLICCGATKIKCFHHYHLHIG